MSKFKRQAWIARDKNGDLWTFFDEKPTKGKCMWCSDGWKDWEINSSLFPSVKWEDAEPTEVEITIKPKEQ